jgi:hypothetical protein
MITQSLLDTIEHCLLNPSSIFVVLFLRIVVWHDEPCFGGSRYCSHCYFG